MRERGFVAGYVALGVGIVVLAMGIALKYAYSVLDRERVAHAKTQASLTLWKDAASQCSAATEKAEKAAQDRATAAQAALQAARKGQAAKDAEIARLRASKPSGACPAADGVARVREGLK